MKPSRIAPRLQARLLAKKEFSRLPICPICRKETPLAQWGQGNVCRACEDAERTHYRYAMLRDELLPDGNPRVPPEPVQASDLPPDDGFDYEEDE